MILEILNTISSSFIAQLQKVGSKFAPHSYCVYCCISKVRKRNPDIKPSENAEIFLFNLEIADEKNQLHSFFFPRVIRYSTRVEVMRSLTALQIAWSGGLILARMMTWVTFLKKEKNGVPGLLLKPFQFKEAGLMLPTSDKWFCYCPIFLNGWWYNLQLRNL